jgi:DNA-binding response OmpR family regulator
MERIRERAPERVLAVLNENYGKPVSGDEISKVVWSDGYRISDHYLHLLMDRCRLLLPEKIKKENAALYCLSHSARYMLSDQLEVGSWFSAPYEPDGSMSILPSQDLDLIHQHEVRSRYLLISRLTPSEYQILRFICDFSGKNEDGFVSTEELAMACFGFQDRDECNCVVNNIFRLRKRIGCLSVELQYEKKKGYRIIKKTLLPVEVQSSGVDAVS